MEDANTKQQGKKTTRNTRTKRTTRAKKNTKEKATSSKRASRAYELGTFDLGSVSPGENARYLRHALVSWDLPPIDVADPVQVEQRVKDYFDFCAENDKKPNIAGMANWIGVHRSTLNLWKRGEYREGTHYNLINKAVNVLEELWVDYMYSGKLNPATGIFIGKNHFGYRDQQDLVVTPKKPLGEEIDQKQLEDRLQEIPIDEIDFGKDSDDY